MTTSTIDKIIQITLERQLRYQDNLTLDDFQRSKEFLMKVQITNYTIPHDGSIQEFGICVSCGEPERLHDIPTTGLSPEDDFLGCSKLCRYCAVNTLAWKASSFSPRGTSLVHHEQAVRDLYNTLVSEKTEKMVKTERAICPSCEHFILEDNAPRRFHGVNAIYKDEERFVHAKCSFTCYSDNYDDSCGRTFVRIPNAHPGVDVFRNEKLCYECFEAFSDSSDLRECPSCCHYYYFEDLIYSERNDDSYCRSCYRQLYYECSDCGEEYQQDDGHSCRSEYDSRIYDYGHKPTPKFFGKAPYYFGLELEIEQIDGDSVSEGVDIVLEDSDRARRIYLKEDGSLSNGFEIVTHPHSLSEFQTVMKWDFLSQLSKANFRSWDTSTCGLHVHISRTAFDDDNHLIRFTKMIYDNKNAVRTLAGRQSDYARFNDSISAGGVGLIRKIKNGMTNDGHVAAVNIETYEGSTVEVRVFRGSLRKERVLSSIEFCHAVVEHTRNMKISPKDRPMSWTKFLSFVSNNSVRYPNLNLVLDQVLNVYRQPTAEERKGND